MDDSYVFSNTSSSSSSTRPARSANAHGNTYKEFSLRKGKWTAEEEAYSNKIISLFNKGLLPIAAGTTLRSFLSDKLQCDPMRITKKYSGASCIGKQIFQVTLKILIKMVFESSNLFIHIHIKCWYSAIWFTKYSRGMQSRNIMYNLISCSNFISFRRWGLMKMS